MVESPEVTLAQAALARRDWALARVHWQNAHDEDPKAFWPRFWLSNLKTRMDDAETGLAELEALIPEKPDCYPLYCAITEAHLMAKPPRLAAAEAFYAILEPMSDKAHTRRFAAWIVRLKLSQPGFPPSVFSLDKSLIQYLTP